MKPLLNTKVFEVVDQKLIKTANKGGSALIKDLEVNMASHMPNSTHLSFKPKYIPSTHVNQAKFGMGQGSNLISSFHEPQMAFLCWYKG
jgi:hypothetical protein